MAGFKIKNPNQRVVMDKMGDKVGDIIDNTHVQQLSFGIEPKLNVEGQIVGYEPTFEMIQKETRTFRIYGQDLKVPGTLYGCNKNESSGKFATTFFFPDMIQNMEEECSKEGFGKALLIETFKSMETINKMMFDMQYWMMSARTLSSVANETSCSPELAEQIGHTYLNNLFSNDDTKFTRTMLLQFIEGERHIAKTLKDMATGNISDAPYIPKSAGITPLTEGDIVEQVYTTPSKKIGFGNNKLAVHGRTVSQNKIPSFGGTKVSDAGSSVLSGIKKK